MGNNSIISQNIYQQDEFKPKPKFSSKGIKEQYKSMKMSRSSKNYNLRSSNIYETDLQNVQNFSKMNFK